jgi:O-antigen/teichoic acid export membrane protein
MRYAPSTTLVSMVVYGGSGLAFAGANLLLARELPMEQFALVTLLVALNTLGYHFAPLGLDGIVMRGRVAFGWPLLRRAALAAAGVGIATSVIASFLYDLSGTLAALLLCGTAAGGLMLVASAIFQSEQRFGVALALIMSPNLVLLLGAVATIATGTRTAALSFDVLTVGLALAAGIGWVLALHKRPPSTSASSTGVPWGEALVLAGVSGAVMLFVQLERLVIPHVLSVADLALFGVLGAIAGSLFRLLQMAVGFSLLPRLRAAATVPERRLLVARELRFALAVSVLGAVAILVLTPLIEDWFLADKYHLSMGLLVAALFSGIAKIAHAFARAAATALATPRELAFVNWVGWLSVALAVIASVVGAPWGLTGVVYGIGLGWLAWAVLAFAVVMHHLRLPEDVAAELGKEAP